MTSYSANGFPKEMYEVVVKERGYRPEPYAIVDALMYADGKPVVDITDMSCRMTGLTRDGLEATWARASREQLARSFSTRSLLHSK